jgi:hypothetical protein
MIINYTGCAKSLRTVLRGLISGTLWIIEIGAERCTESVSFVWNFKNIDYLKNSMSYGRYTKKSVFAFFRAS